MLRILGNQKRLCDGMTRRDLLHVGGLGLFGLNLSDWLRFNELGAAVSAPTGTFGKAKSCILLYLFGAPGQHETFDPKPDAPAEIQGELKSIPTSVPGVHLGEGLPQVAEIADRLTVVRSLTHPYALHGVPYALSGEPDVDPSRELERSVKRWPFIGSVVDYIEATRASGKQPLIPRNVALPFPLYKYADYPLLAGPYGGFLGSQYDPVYTDFQDKGTKTAPMPTANRRSAFRNPYAGIDPGAKFQLGGSDSVLPDLRNGRFDLRQSLLKQLDQGLRWTESDTNVRQSTHYQNLAYSLMSSGDLHKALDIDCEPMKVRDRYGMTLFGQSALAGRRLIEAGSKFVTVFWDAYGDMVGGWDTHFNHYPRMKNFLLPGFDQTYSALILDLEARGLLEDTLVLCLSEHGRTPKIDSKPPGAGRHHWSRAYSAVLAGGGMGRANVVGQTDAVAGDVVRTPVSPKDILATAFHLLGIDPYTNVVDHLDRQIPIAGDGKIRRELFG